MRETRADAPRERRLTVTEVGELALDVGPDARTIAVLVRLAGAAPTEETLATIVAARLGVAPRWACRVVRPGRRRRPVWRPAPDFDPRAHVRTVACGGDGGGAALLARLTDVAREPWDFGRPPWRLTRVTGVADGRDAVVLTLHHVLADGPGVLATAGALLGMAPGPEASGPGRRAVEVPEVGAVGGAGRQARRLGPVAAALRTVGSAVVEVAAGVGPGARRTSLRMPVRPGFALAVVDLDLAAVRAAARRHRATVNDVLLVAGARSLADVLARRGESTDRIIISVPVTRLRAGEADRRVRTGVIRVPVPVPKTSVTDSLARTAALTARRRRFASGESSVVLAQVFRVFAALGIYRWILEHQRVIDTVVTNLPGPVERLTVAGVPVEEIVPVAPGVGNVPIFFVVLSYAGRLVVCVRADDQVRAELPAVVASFRAAVAEIVRA